MPQLPDGLRIYAIGDIHGRFDLLQALYASIRSELAEGRPPQSVEIFLGDYVDRGPQSRDVLDWLIGSPPVTGRRICLLGNHEDMLLNVLADPGAMPNWLSNGASETLLSYDVNTPVSTAPVALANARAAFLRAFPEPHRAFVESLPRSVSCGSYFFAHAGVRPGRALEDQDPQDLVWIREPFLLSNADFGKVVVHGHTPVEFPELRPNRIGIDTGAVFSGRLTCLVLEGSEQRFRQTAPR
jgi:serine/threonine protein phosphatase 1